MVSGNNVLSLDRNIIKPFPVTRRNPLVLLQSPCVFSTFLSICESNQEYSQHFSEQQDYPFGYDEIIGCRELTGYCVFSHFLLSPHLQLD